MKILMVVRRFVIFWRAGVWACIFGAIVDIAAHVLSTSVDRLMIAVSIVTFWIMLMLASRRVVIAEARRRLSQVSASTMATTPELRLELARTIRAALPSSALWQSAGARSWIIGEARSRLTPSGGARVGTALVDEADDEMLAFYGPVQALTWALPAIGFVGTAWHLRLVVQMAFAMTGHSENQQAVDFGSLNESFSSAFSILSMALAVTAISHVAVSLAMQSEVAFRTTLRDVVALLWIRSDSPTVEISSK